MTSPTRSRTSAGTPDETSVDQGEAATSAPEDTTTSSNRGPWVKYSGDAGTREISATDWKRAGVEDQKLVRWNEENDYLVPKSELSEDALAVLERDPNLNVVDKK